MPRRAILTKRQRTRLLDLPTDAASLHEHYTLDDFDLEQIGQRRRSHNKMGFAVQLCVLRYPGRLLAPGEMIPVEILRFLADQIGIKADDLAGYATGEETRHNHLAQLRDLYGFKTFTGRGAAELRQWLLDQAFHATSNQELADRFIARCRETQIILPGVSTIERRFDALLEDMATDQLTRFVWLRQFDAGNNSRSANQLLERLERLQKIELSPDLLANIPLHKIKRLRRHGSMRFRMVDARIDDAKTNIQDTLAFFKDMGSSLLAAHCDNQSLEAAIHWPERENLVVMAGKLTSTMAADPIAHVTGGWGRFRRYAPRMLRVLKTEAVPVCMPLLKAVHLIRDKKSGHDQPAGFLRKTSKWHRHLKADDVRLWEVSVFFHLRDAFRSGDIWVAHSERFADLSKSLVLASALPTSSKLAVPVDVNVWLAEGLNLGLRKMAETSNSHGY